jgi:anti-sigma regulatory factor (Ser/Thr protein kinase)
VKGADVSTAARFHHEALFYRGDDSFIEGTADFVREGLAGGEAVLVALVPEKTALLRDALGNDAAKVPFLDMKEIGGNPARIIPEWQRFVDSSAALGRSARGIGEPVWADRGADEIAECHVHEHLLNTAFDGGPGWRLRCPYDADALSPAVVAEAERSHPLLVVDDLLADSASYLAAGDDASGLLGPLPDHHPEARLLRFDSETLPGVRLTLLVAAQAAGLSSGRTEELILAAHEAATNSIRYGGGDGELRSWHDGTQFVCEIRDRGRITLPLAGRVMPDGEQEGGRGLWMINQLCDLVQLRSSQEGTSVRMYMRRHDRRT